ncbi:MAG: hypothetical protein RIB98_04455, partial [Acidimicrobiales bacterium]
MVDEGLLQAMDEALDELLVTPIALDSWAEGAALVRSVEACARKLRAVQVRVQGELDGSGLYSADGFVSAKTMVRHCGRLSPSRAAARERGTRMAVTLPDVWAALSAGML